MPDVPSAGPLVRELKRTCPICKITIYRATLAERELLLCEECHGTAWPRETLMKTQPQDAALPIVRGPEGEAHKTPPYFTPRQKPPFLICPFCQKRMKEEKLAGGPVDICEKCTCLWLDGPKNARFKDLLGPYKWKAAKAR
jgi:Zn-finger nucleic acid-binding protein